MSPPLVCGFHDLLTVQLLQLAFAPLVVLELLLQAPPEDAEGGDQGVEPVERVRACVLRVGVELEIDPLVTVGDLSAAA
jgi:hypothetical protein